MAEEKVQTDQLPQDKEDKKDKKKDNKKRFHGKEKHRGSRGRVITDGSNDARWYGSDAIVKLAANYSFFKALGLPVKWSTSDAPGAERTVPGIMAIQIMDALPRTSDNPEVDAINIAAKQQYALIRKANSGSKNYEWTDLIIYELARSSVNEIFAFIGRAYGVANVYNMQNRYLPRTLLTMMGFDADDFISNLASIRLWLNHFARRINTLALPHSLSYFERKAWLYSNIYTDGDTAKAQIYFLTPGDNQEGDSAIFLKYDPTYVNTGGALIPVPLFGQGNSFQSWRTVADEFLDVLLSDDDCAIISGDILKAYGDASLFKCNEIPEDYVVTPSHNTEVLSQFENLTLAPNSFPEDVGSADIDDLLSKGSICQEDGVLKFAPQFDPGVTTLAKQGDFIINPIINFHSTDVSPDQVMVGTRLTATFKAGKADPSIRYLTVDACGTEIVLALKIARSPDQFNYIDRTVRHVSNNAASYMGVLANLMDIVPFDWHPKVYLIDDADRNHYPVFGDLSTYRVLDSNELKKLHDTATMSLFAVPLISDYSK